MDSLDRAPRIEFTINLTSDGDRPLSRLTLRCCYLSVALRGRRIAFRGPRGTFCTAHTPETDQAKRNLVEFLRSLLAA